jgi:hypothetical protein
MGCLFELRKSAKKGEKVQPWLITGFPPNTPPSSRFCISCLQFESSPGACGCGFEKRQMAAEKKRQKLQNNDGKGYTRSTPIPGTSAAQGWDTSWSFGKGFHLQRAQTFPRPCTDGMNSSCILELLNACRPLKATCWAWRLHPSIHALLTHSTPHTQTFGLDREKKGTKAAVPMQGEPCQNPNTCAVRPLLHSIRKLHMWRYLLSGRMQALILPFFSFFFSLLSVFAILTPP